MVAFRAVALTTVAVLALSRAASAADLLPPPPAVELPPPPAIDAGGWYLRGDLGVGFNNSVSGKTSPNPLDTTGGNASDNWYNSSLSEAALFDVGVGYQVNNWFRADVTGELRGGSSFSGLEVLNVSSGPNAGYQAADFYRGSLSSEIALANAYFDLGSWYGITPFVGGGVGVSFNNFYGGTDNGVIGPAGGGAVSPSGGILGNNSQTSFAWALMAGLDMKINRHLKFEIGYRYLNYGSFKSGGSSCLSGSGTTGSFSLANCGGTPFTIASSHTLSSNDVRIGLRYYFDDVAEAPPEQPIIRKY